MFLGPVRLAELMTNVAIFFFFLFTALRLGQRRIQEKKNQREEQAQKPQEESNPQLTERSQGVRSGKAYAPTPRQLESLAKARKAKKAKKEQQAAPIVVDDVTLARDLDVGEEPKPVVRDNRLVKEFVDSQK
jgi:hypothetical protein